MSRPGRRPLPASRPPHRLRPPRPSRAPAPGRRQRRAAGPRSGRRAPRRCANVVVDFRLFSRSSSSSTTLGTTRRGGVEGAPARGVDAAAACDGSGPCDRLPRPTTQAMPPLRAPRVRQPLRPVRRPVHQQLGAAADSGVTAVGPAGSPFAAGVGPAAAGGGPAADSPAIGDPTVSGGDRLPRQRPAARPPLRSTVSRLRPQQRPSTRRRLPPVSAPETERLPIVRRDAVLGAGGSGRPRLLRASCLLGHRTRGLLVRSCDGAGGFGYGCGRWGRRRALGRGRRSAGRLRPCRWGVADPGLPGGRVLSGRRRPGRGDRLLNRRPIRHGCRLLLPASPRRSRRRRARRGRWRFRGRGDGGSRRFNRRHWLDAVGSAVGFTMGAGLDGGSATGGWACAGCSGAATAAGSDGASAPGCSGG